MKTNCKTCRKMIDILEVFSTGECVDCYEKSFDSIQDKRPDFVGAINASPLYFCKKCENQVTSVDNIDGYCISCQ